MDIEELFERDIRPLVERIVELCNANGILFNMQFKPADNGPQSEEAANTTDDSTDRSGFSDFE